MTNGAKMSITYEVRKIVEENVNNHSKRDVVVTIEKVMDLKCPLKLEVTTFKVSYPVLDDRPMFHLVDTLPPRKNLDHTEVIEIANVLKLYN